MCAVFPACQSTASDSTIPRSYNRRSLQYAKNPSPHDWRCTRNPTLANVGFFSYPVLGLPSEQNDRFRLPGMPGGLDRDPDNVLSRVNSFDYLDATRRGFPIVLAKFQLLRNYTFFHNEF